MRLLILISILAPLPSYGALVASWNFNSLSIASASSPGSGGAPTSISASSGSGILGLSNWSGTVDDFSGSSLNANGSDPAEESLSLIAGSGTAGNGSHILIEFSMSGMSNPILSFATQGTATGFNSVQLAWSTDGSNFTDHDAAYNPAASYGLQSFDLTDINALDDTATAYLRLTFDGATGSSGNNRIDNIQVNAIPESSTALMWLIGAAALSLLRRR
jgi:hypothetical protein